MQISNLNFLEAAENDLSSIIEMEQDPANKSFIYPYTMDRHLEVLGRKDEFCIVARNDQMETIGFMIFAFTPKETRSMEFRRFVVQQKGNGFGRAFIRWAKDFAFQKHDMNRLWLDVFSDNFRAISLYQKMGFKCEGMKRAAVLEKGQWKSQYLMSFLRSEYESDKILVKDTSPFNLNHTFFKSEELVKQGEVDTNTVFHYQQKGNIVWATYHGGLIKMGNLCGKILGNKLEFTYQQVNRQEELKRGKCHSILKLENNRLTLHEQWEWDNGITGQSKLLQIIM